MYKYIYRISKLLVILLVTLSSASIIGTLMEARGAQELEVFAMSASSESLATDSDLSGKDTSQLDNSAQEKGAADKPSARERNTLNAPPAANDGLFNPFTVYASGSWAEAVVSGEWDGDGKNDVMLVTGLDFDEASPPGLGGIEGGHLFEQTAPDVLTLTGSLEAGESPTALARGDFNHDGLDDVAILSQGDNTLGIFLQSGGTLGAMSTYNTEDSPDSLAVGDFNGDLRDDIAVSHANSQSLALYHQQEDATLGSPISHDVRSGGFNVLASGDLNGDGYDDLVLLRGAGASEEQLAIFYQEAGGLTEPIVRTVQDDTYLSYGLAVGDMTGDGRDDIVVSAGGNSTHASLNVFVQQSDGTVATEATIYDSSHLPKAVAIGDVNHDGLNDLLVVHAAWQTLSLYSQSETGTLNSAVAYDLPYTDDYRPHALALADVTDDGGLDVLLANHSALPEENGLVVLSNTSNAPTSRITSPYPSLHLTESTPILIEGTASANAATLEVSTDGGQTWQSQPASPNWSYNWSPPSDGSHIILSRAIDAAGNVQSPPARTRILISTLALTPTPSNTPVSPTPTSEPPTMTLTPTNTQVVPTATPSATPPPSDQVLLVLSPATVNTGVGQTFDVAIEVMAGEESVDGAAAYLNFDPTYLQVLSMTSSGVFQYEFTNEFDNSAGHVNFVGGSFANLPSGTFTLATITFETLAQTDGSTIEFNMSALRESDVTSGGGSILDGTIPSTLIVSNTTIDASLTLQGRPSAPDSRWVVPLRVSLTVPGEGTPAYEFEPTTDENGHFTLTGIEAGTYEVRVKHAHTLQNVQTVTLAAGSNTIDLGTLREGDANDDNFITIIDFSILAATFGVCEGSGGYDERADFNGDGCIAILDFSLLASNFGQSGQSAPEGGERASLPELGGIDAPAGRSFDVALALEPAQRAVSTGDTFTVMTAIEAGEQAVDGAQVVLNFDPELLEVVTVSGGERLPQGLQNEVDNETGTLRFAAGTLEAFPNGTIELLEVQFKALALTNGTSLSFAEGTDVTFGGDSVLGEQAGGTIVISDPTSVTMSRLSGSSPSPLWALLPLALTILAGAFISRRRG